MSFFLFFNSHNISLWPILWGKAKSSYYSNKHHFFLDILFVFLYLGAALEELSIYYKRLTMNEDLPLHRYAILACWLLFITGTIALFIIPGISHNYNRFQPSNYYSTYRAAIFQQQAEEPVYLFHAIIQEASNRYQVDPALIRAIIMAESSYNPRAISGKGARGLMQLMPATAKALGVEDSFNPEHNIYGGVKYFKQLLD
ncbi:MAG: lytic transglycosylase domain-containing protein, partial [Bacteroidales bacterium]|nr:lytic transglycosylase domain-containing protein [Bacteroidales bacterium]